MTVCKCYFGTGPNSYKFTVAENTPLEQDVALDPELLGQVFENLLASYNPETKTTARKQTGSFYTPREIVEYMVNESVAAHLREKVGADWKDNPQTISALNDIKILDPACGSGAFPMGILHTMVDILKTLDPENEHWRAIQKQKAIAETEQAYNIGNQEDRDYRLQEISDIFENNSSDYGRKLFLIENCIFGVDIQPIAVQIAKLRFFISLIVDQKPDKDKDNFGIRPLPNLETKFVAAHTLEGLENSLFRTPEIEKKESELKQVRHDYFTANTRKKKLDLQKKDKKLRNELAQILKTLNFAENSANQIADFDPYDLNASSPFFDAEWMFGVKDGFDVVIGNPPYKQIRKKILSAKQYPYSEGKDKGKQNLYKVFVEASYNLTNKDSGFTCLIVQSSLMCDQSSIHTRELLLSKTTIEQVIEFPKKSSDPNAQVFESVLQGTCIILFKKQPPNTKHSVCLSVDNNTQTISKLDFEIVLQIDLLALKSFGYPLPLVHCGEFKIWHMIRTSKKLFQVLMDEISKGDLNLGTNANTFSPQKSTVKLYRGKNVHRYQLDIEVDEYLKSGFFKHKILANAKNIMLVCQEVTGTVDPRRLIFTLVENLPFQFVFGDTVQKITLKNQSQSKVILGILNSRFMDWFFRKTSTNNHIGGYELEQLPMPDFTAYPTECERIDTLVDNILSEKNSEGTSDLEQQIDKLVYKLYGLTKPEIEIVKGIAK